MSVSFRPVLSDAAYGNPMMLASWNNWLSRAGGLNSHGEMVTVEVPINRGCEIGPSIPATSFLGPQNLNYIDLHGKYILW